MVKSKRAAAVRYAVVGTGWFAQDAVLPAFANAKNSELAAIFSGDPEKRNELGDRYGVPAYDYEDFEEKLAGARVRRGLYRPAQLAAQGVHASRRPARRSRPLREAARGQCRRMPRDDRRLRARRRELMTAYRLHFESANLAAIEHITGRRHRRAAPVPRLQLPDDRGGEHAARCRSQGRAAHGPGHLLHQRRPLPLPRRPHRGERLRVPSARPALPRGAGNGYRRDALPRRAAGDVLLRLRGIQGLRIPRRRHHGPTSASIPPTPSAATSRCTSRRRGT